MAPTIGDIFVDVTARRIVHGLRLGDSRPRLLRIKDAATYISVSRRTLGWRV